MSTPLGRAIVGMVQDWLQSANRGQEKAVVNDEELYEELYLEILQELYKIDLPEIDYKLIAQKIMARIRLYEQAKQPYAMLDNMTIEPQFPTEGNEKGDAISEALGKNHIRY